MYTWFVSFKDMPRLTWLLSCMYYASFDFSKNFLKTCAKSMGYKANDNEFYSHAASIMPIA